MNSSHFLNSSSALQIGKLRMAKRLVCAALIGVQAMSSWAQTPCENGMAGQYPCDGLDLMSVRSFEELGGTPPGNGNDCWGWSRNGREFVLFGRSDGTSIVEITDPVNPVMMANVPTASIPSLWRDIKVIGDVAYIVSEAGEHGIQAIDLEQVLTMEPMASVPLLSWYTGIGNAHNIAANPETNFVYGVGTDTFNGGLHIVDVANPSNPTLAGGWEQGYIHDAQVVIYNGPDDDHVGKEIAFAFGGFSGCYIIDVEDKTDCQTLSSLSDEAWVYSHQGWLTEDHRFVLVNDEIDESTGIAPLTRTWVLDVQDLDNPSVIGFHEGTLGVTDHNLYTHQGLVYGANYYAGLQILDVVDPEALAFEQVAFFDTNPFSNQVGTSGGAWNVYPYFESGNIAISTQSHLFVVAPSEPVSGVQESASAAALDVRSGDGIIYTTLGASQSQNLKVFDALGRLKAEWLALPEVTMQWMVSDWDPGVYVVRSADGAQARFVVD